MRPTDTIGYWLYYAHHRVAYAFVEVLRAHCVERGKPYVITPPQWAVLGWLHEHDGLTMGTIARKHGVDAPTITGTVKRLEHSGLVERLHDREDHRVVKVYLTAEGQDIVASVLPVVAKFDESIGQGFSHEERQAFLEQVQRTIANASTVTQGPVDRFELLLEHCQENP